MSLAEAAEAMMQQQRSELQMQDDPMDGENGEAPADEEGEGDDVVSDDSSVEPEEDEEAERKVREGFIVDEDEDEEEDDDEERRRRRKRRKRKHHRRRDEDVEEALDEDDLDLLEENTGGRVSRLTRLRRGRDDDEPVSKRKAVVESSDDDLDESNIIDGTRTVHDIQSIWDDERAGLRDEDEDMDMDDFIDDEDEEEEGAGAMAEEEREERRRERRRAEMERRKAIRSRPELMGMDEHTWDEILEVFGDGHDYDWALTPDDEDNLVEEPTKPEIKYHDVFEPSEIKKRLLTDDDDLIRAQDIPERMQLATSTLSSSVTLSLLDTLSPDDCTEAAAWVTPLLSNAKERDFFRPDGRYHHLLGELVVAVTRALEYLLYRKLEVPYIYTHRRDYITCLHSSDSRIRVELLNQDDLWRVYALGQKYISLRQRQNTLLATIERLGSEDEYFEEHLKSAMETVEAVADVTQWISMKYKRERKDRFELHFHDDEDAETKKHKMPSRISSYEIAKRSIVSKLADGFGIKTYEVVINFVTSGHNVHFVDDQDLSPSAYAEQFVDPDPQKAVSTDQLLRQARMILSTELGVDPLLRREIRKLFKAHAQISVIPTEKGKTKIDEYHPYHNFKYLLNKPVSDMLQSTQFLNIIAAETEHLIQVTIAIPSDVRQTFQNQLNDAFASDSFSDNAKAWNEERMLVVHETMEQHLIPAGVKWTREYLREEVEDFLARRCAAAFYERINVEPFASPEMKHGDTPSVLALSFGKGDPKKDDISFVFLDEAGRLRDHFQLDNLQDQEHKDEFLDFVKRRKPDVIAVGGFSIHTTKLVQDVKKQLRGDSQAGATDPSFNSFGTDGTNEQSINTPVIYVHDDVARLFQHSKRAAEEFSSLPIIAKYCVGLARYVQSPLNEFAALGSDITAITFDEEAQQLVPRERLLMAYERSLVDVVNKVGVDINRAVNEPYYAHLLPYVAGLGPRKAQALAKKIASMGGNLVNREQFIKSSILTTRIFINASGFLQISQEHDIKELKGRSGNVDWSNSPDPLDSTRIHPEDYDLARKMAIDALELDEEDIHDEHPSYVVSVIMKDEDNVKKLDELNLDEFADSMFESNQDLKRHTLNVIRSELLDPFSESRAKFILPDAQEVLTMLTGETEHTLRVGLIVSVLILRIKPNYVVVRLDSGIEGVINVQYLAEQPNINPDTYVTKGQTIPGVIIDVKKDLEHDQFSVELSSRPTDVQAGDAAIRRVRTDEHWNDNQAARDLELQQRKQRAEVNRTRRVIKHPNFHNFNSAQAEAFLDKQHPGDVVIRPSSKGPNHLAVTWKVADKLFQHIDVVEPNANLSGQDVGGQLIVEGKYEFADLDELIVNHVHPMARRIEDLMNHEKYRKDEDELNNFLTSFVAANPAKSIYGFCLNRKRPGHFNLSFLAKKGSTIQTWPVRVAPEAYYLFDTGAVGVAELCDAFKYRHLHESQNAAVAGAGGKTPYGAGRMTPGRTPGYTTPGHMSVRQPARTPNPYPSTTAPISSLSIGGWSTPAQPQTYAGYQTPGRSHPPPPTYPPAMGGTSVPSGMHPSRAAMIQNSAVSGGTGARW